MKIAVMGTGRVGHVIANKLLALGHEVRMGSRSATNDKAAAFASSHAAASAGSFADAAAWCELAFNCTAGVASLEALGGLDESLADKVLVDLANPLDFSQGMPPRLSLCNDDSVGEQLQKALPRAKVVKSLNTMNCEIMVEPSKLEGEHVVFVCGEDQGAKAQVRSLLSEGFGWRDTQIMDLGGIAQSRGTEMFLPLWVRMWGALGTGDFNIQIARAQGS